MLDPTLVPLVVASTSLAQEAKKHLPRAQQAAASDTWDSVAGSEDESAAASVSEPSTLEIPYVASFVFGNGEHGNEVTTRSSAHFFFFQTLLMMCSHFSIPYFVVLQGVDAERGSQNNISGSPPVPAKVSKLLNRYIRQQQHAETDTENDEISDNTADVKMYTQKHALPDKHICVGTRAFVFVSDGSINFTKVMQEWLRHVGGEKFTEHYPEETVPDVFRRTLSMSTMLRFMCVAAGDRSGGSERARDMHENSTDYLNAVQADDERSMSIFAQFAPSQVCVETEQILKNSERDVSWKIEGTSLAPQLQCDTYGTLFGACSGRFEKVGDSFGDLSTNWEDNEAGEGLEDGEEGGATAAKKGKVTGDDAPTKLKRTPLGVPCELPLSCRRDNGREFNVKPVTGTLLDATRTGSRWVVPAYNHWACLRRAQNPFAIPPAVKPMRAGTTKTSTDHSSVHERARCA